MTSDAPSRHPLRARLAPRLVRVFALAALTLAGATRARDDAGTR